MGHMLETMNQAAIDNIGGQQAEGPTPGSWVIYICRPGEGRRGRTEFPALVMFRCDDAMTLDLLVVYDANDVVMREHTPRQSPQQDSQCWRLMDEAKMQQFNPDRMNDMRLQLASLQGTVTMLHGEVSSMRQAVFGEEGIIADFEARLVAAEKAGNLSQRVNAAEARSKAKTKKK